MPSGVYRRTEYHRQRMRETIGVSMRARWQTKEFRVKMSALLRGNTYALGNKLSEEHKRRIAAFISATRNGENNPNWKGGRKRQHKILYGSRRYKEWRQNVFKRDGYQCQWCGAKNGFGRAVYLEAHHEKEWADYPELRFEVSNGITLCKDCHNTTKKGRPQKYGTLKKQTYFTPTAAGRDFQGKRQNSSRVSMRHGNKPCHVRRQDGSFTQQRLVLSGSIAFGSADQGSNDAAIIP